MSLWTIVNDKTKESRFIDVPKEGAEIPIGKHERVVPPPIPLMSKDEVRREILAPNRLPPYIFREQGAPLSGYAKNILRQVPQKHTFMPRLPRMKMPRW